MTGVFYFRGSGGPTVGRGGFRALGVKEAGKNAALLVPEEFEATPGGWPVISEGAETGSKVAPKTAMLELPAEAGNQLFVETLVAVAGESQG